jgi:phosphoglycolate phosphatase-like HAD superfamily hydrolase
MTESVESAEARAEREREQEAQQDLHAGEEHPQLLQQLGEVAVSALQRRLRPLTAVPGVIALLARLRHREHRVAYPDAPDRKQPPTG